VFVCCFVVGGGGGGGGVLSLGDQEKILQIRHISKEKYGLSSPYLDYSSLQVASTLQCFKKFLLVSLTCSQIWLSPLVGDCSSTYLMKLEKKKPLG